MSDENEKLLERVLENEKVMNMDDRDIHPNVRVGWATRIREAGDLYKAAWAEYRDLCMRNTVAIFVTGSRERSAQFATVAAAEGSTITLEADGLYRKLAERVEPMLGEGSRQLMPQHVSILYENLHEETEKLGVDVTPKIMDLPILKDLDAVTQFIRDLIRDCAGDLLNGQYIAAQLASMQKAVRYKGGTIKAVVTGATESEVPGLGSQFGYVGATTKAPAGAEVTREQVLGVFRQVNRKMKDVSAR